MVLFHAYLNLAGFVNFSAFAGLFLFLAIASNKSLSSQRRRFGLIALQLGSLSVFLVNYYGYRIAAIPPQSVDYIAGCFYNAFWFSAFSILMIGRFDVINYEPLRIPFHIRAVIAGVLLWTSQPYIGLSNAGNLTMFSNLETRKDRSNHLLVNTSFTKIWGFEEDTVRVIELPSSFRTGRDSDISFLDLPKNEFSFLVAYWADNIDQPIPSKILYRDEIIEYKDLRKTEFAKTRWYTRFLHYRALDRVGPTRCRW